MNLDIPSRATRRRGAILIHVLFVVIVGMVLLAGVGSFVATHQGRAKIDADYAAAMDMAEAGANYEFSRLTTNPRSADQPPGQLYSYAGGLFRVYCAGDPTGTVRWPPLTGSIPNNLWVFCTGTVNGVSRTVRVSVRGYNVQGDYAIYGINSVSLTGSVTVVGDIGSNGPIHDQGSVDLRGSVYLNGAGASFDGTGVPVIQNPDPYIWPTVDQMVASEFPQGGWTWLAGHNDNNLVSSPNFTANQITGSVTLRGKPGGANYYVTGVSLGGNGQVVFDNTGGPISIWIGPGGATGDVYFRGTTDGSTLESAGGYQVNVYVGVRGATYLTMNGNTSLHANIYAYNGVPGDYYGSVTYRGTPDIYGTILAYNVDLGGDPGVHYVVGSEQPVTDGYYGYCDSWAELNPR